jgi:GNAT superfamily N-acetyltransferase
MLIYRKAVIEDLDALIQLRMDSLTEDRGFLSETEQSAVAAQLREYFPKHIGSDFIAYLAEMEDGIAATAFLVIEEKPANPAFITGKTGTVMNVLTYPEYRKQGAATALLKHLIDEARARGLSHIGLSATEAGKPLYEKLGFEVQQSHYTGMKYQLI